MQNDAQLESLLNVISSAVGSLTNPKKLEDTFASSGTENCRQAQYVQSAFSIPTTEKRQQEERPLVNVGDGFRKVVVTKDNVIRHNDENGILIVSLREFLMDEGALEK